MRWVTLIIGLFLALMAFLYKDLVTGLLSAFFILQAVSNKGCMVSQSCGIPTELEANPEFEESTTEYTEVK